MSEIPEKLFYKPGEVCKYTDTQPYVLRFWESEFPRLAPNRSRTGQRVYRREDLEMVLRIKKLLYEQEYTIADARRALDAEQRDAPPPSRVAEPVVEEEDHDPPVPPERTVERDDPAEPHDAGALEDRIAGLESRCARAEAERDALRDRCERVAGRLERLLAALPKGSGGEPQD